MASQSQAKFSSVPKEAKEASGDEPNLQNPEEKLEAMKRRCLELEAALVEATKPEFVAELCRIKGRMRQLEEEEEATDEEEQENDKEGSKNTDEMNESKSD